MELGPVENITAAMTAGGQSSRFGSDKALAVVGGRTLLERVADSLDACPTRLLIAPVGKYHLPGWDVVSDLRPGCGPLGGLETALATALAKAPAGWVAFAGVDIPGLDRGYWEALEAALWGTDSGQEDVERRAWNVDKDGVSPRSTTHAPRSLLQSPLSGSQASNGAKALAVQALHDGQPQPLAALYHTDLLPRITALLDAGERRLRLAAPPEQTVLVPGLAAEYFRNVNKPEDLPCTEFNAGSIR